MCTTKRASTCCAKDRRYCCCQKERCHRDWPDPRGTSSVVQSVCRYRRREKEPPAGCTANTPKAGVFFSEVTFLVRLTFVDICVCLLPDDAELDGRQTGGRPVWEGQCQCHRQSQQHLHALCCFRGHEDMCGGERKRVELCPPLSGWAVSGDLSVGSANCVSSSKTCLTISDQFLHQQCLFCVWLSHLSGLSSFAREAFTVFAFARKIDFLYWREMKQKHVGPISGFPLTFLEFIYSPPSHLAADSERSRPFRWGWGKANAVWPCRAPSPHWAGPEPGVTDGFFLLILSAVKRRHTQWKHPAAIQGGETTVTKLGVSCWPI